MRVKRHHWLNTYLGIIDSAFLLTDEEQFHIIQIINKLLKGLDIPNRGGCLCLPSAVALEVESAFYTILLQGNKNRSEQQGARSVASSDLVVSLDTWRDALTSLIFNSYDNLTPEEKLFAAKTFGDLLAALGVPERAAAYFPDTVLRAWVSSPEAVENW